MEIVDKFCLICADNTSKEYIFIYENSSELLEKITKYLPIKVNRSVLFRSNI